ncbi:unnamed protein product [Periconia digitata]|uniref:2EXR domain-containing protein n=1 Tax=Periconia digitata TaxID=1303443 RepID=A0A9W4UNQ5_9PLEO|nr:unnamed protein product [Periconia digitata]
MPALTFAQLPRELRDMIWVAAAAAQYQHIADGASKLSTKLGAEERLRQAFVGYESLPQDVEKQPLRVCVNDNGKRVHLHVNEIQTLVNRLPIATVCSESRRQAIAFCLSQVDIVDLHYAIDANDYSGDEMIDGLLLLNPTTVVVTNTYRPHDAWDALREFDSAEQFVTTIDRFFGSSVKHVVLNLWFHASETLERVYWPHLECTRDNKQLDGSYIDDPNHDIYTILMTPDRLLKVREEIFRVGKDPKFTLQSIYHHLLKFYEIWDACKGKQKLLSLRTMELDLHTHSSGEILQTHVKATMKDDGVLWTNRNECEIGFDLDFFAYVDSE